MMNRLSSYESLISIENKITDGKLRFAFVEEVKKKKKKKKHTCLSYMYIRRHESEIKCREATLSVSDFIFRFSSVGFIKVHFLYVITVLQ